MGRRGYAGGAGSWGWGVRLVRFGHGQVVTENGRARAGSGSEPAGLRTVRMGCVCLYRRSPFTWTGTALFHDPRGRVRGLAVGNDQGLAGCQLLLEGGFDGGHVLFGGHVADPDLFDLFVDDLVGLGREE